MQVNPVCEARHMPFVTTSTAVDGTATRVFLALQPLHQLTLHDLDLLHRAAAGLRLIRSAGDYGESEHRLFRVALAGLEARDAFVVEFAACCAADSVSLRELGSAGPAVHHRAMWLAAIVRLADALCAAAPRHLGAYAAWTDEVVYLEFDGLANLPWAIEGASRRVAALEALTGRRVHLASSAERRGAA